MAKSFKFVTINCKIDEVSKLRNFRDKAIHCDLLLIFADDVINSSSIYSILYESQPGYYIIGRRKLYVNQEEYNELN